MRGKNSGRTTIVNTFCSKRKDLSHSNSQISLPVMINKEDLTHVHPILKKIFSKQKIPKCALAGRIKEFLPAWKLLKGEKNQPVINLKDLNRFISYKHFKIEGLHCLKYVLQKGDYMCKVDLKDAYFSVSLHKIHEN